MSVNIDIELDVTGFASEGQAEAVREAVIDVVEDRALSRTMEVSLSGHGENVKVVGRSFWPVSISGVGRWQEDLEARLKAAVQSVASQAKVSLFCNDVDLERALEDDTI